MEPAGTTNGPHAAPIRASRPRPSRSPIAPAVAALLWAHFQTSGRLLSASVNPERSATSGCFPTVPSSKTLLRSPPEKKSLTAAGSHLSTTPPTRGPLTYGQTDCCVGPGDRGWGRQLLKHSVCAPPPTPPHPSSTHACMNKCAHTHASRSTNDQRLQLLSISTASSLPLRATPPAPPPRRRPRARYRRRTRSGYQRRESFSDPGLRENRPGR